MSGERVVWHGWKASVLSFGIVSQRYVEALRRLGVEPYWHLILPDADGLDTAPQCGIRVHHHGAENLRPVSSAQINVGCTAFEVTKLPKSWLQRLLAMDEIWVPSRFNRETLIRGGVPRGRVRVIPHGVDTTRFRPDQPRLRRLAPRGAFKFLAVGVWTFRKGWDILLQAYRRAFGRHDEVCLLIKAGRWPRHRAELRRSLRGWSGPPILVLPMWVNDDMMPRVYASVDSFVLPSRGEAWGMVYSEAMATALPTIGPAIGGNREFMNGRNSLLIATRQHLRDRRPLAPWTEPDVDDLVEKLRWVRAARPEAGSLGWRACCEMKCYWTWERAAARIVDRLSALSKRL